jgi:ankyrin repeat protein
VNEFDRLQYTPLQYALMSEDGKITPLETLQYLIEQKSDINLKNQQQNETSFLIAIRNQHISLDILKYLVDSKGEIYDFDNEHKNFFDPLFENKNLTVEMVEYFIEKKWDPLQKGENGKTPLRLLCSYHIVPLEVLKYFVEKDESLITVKSYNKTTLLHLACQSNYVTLDHIKYLVEKNSDLNSMDDLYPTPFNCATSKNYTILKYFFDIGAPLFNNCSKFFNIPEKNLSIESLIVFLSQPNYFFENRYKELNEKFQNLFLEYNNGTLWNIERN